MTKYSLDDFCGGTLIRAIRDKWDTLGNKDEVYLAAAAIEAIREVLEGEQKGDRDTGLVPRKPQVGDIAIHNIGALVFIGVVHHISVFPNLETLVSGPAIACGTTDNKFYSAEFHHYFDVKDSVFVERPPASIPAIISLPIVEPVLGSRPDEVPF